jgi:hypothetical protein
MNKSDDISALAAALSALQGELEDVYKGSKGYGYSYADLSSVLYIIRPLLKKHSLSIVQPVGGDDGKISVTTMLMHSSGQFISETVNMAIDLSNKKMNSLQAAGSSITYLRRYCISSILGLSSTDDDGKIGGDQMDELRKDLITYVAASSLESTLNNDIVVKALIHYGAKEIENLTTQQLQAIIARINKG